MAQKTEGPAQPPSNLPTGDGTFDNATMRAALQRAAEKAGIGSVADIPTVEAPPAVVEAAPPATEVVPQASDVAASEVAPASPNVSAEALAKAELPPDAELDDYVDSVKKEYLNLAADIRSYRTTSIERLDPQRDLPTEFGAAYATFNNVKTFAQDYKKEKDPTKKAQILKKITLNGDKELWQRIYDDVARGLQRLQAEPIPDVPALVAQQVETPVPESAKATPVEPVKAPPATAAKLEVVAPPAPEVTPPAAPAKKEPVARAKREPSAKPKKIGATKKHASAKKEIGSVATSTPTPAEQAEGRVYGLSMTADEVKRYRAALAKAVRKASAKPAEGAKETFDSEALLKDINSRYDELAGEMKAQHIEPAEVLFAMRPVSAIEARLQAALDAREATDDPAAKVKAEREARAAYDELMGSATQVVHEAIGRTRASRDALEASEAEGAPAETLESSTPPEGSAAEKMLARPIEASATDTLESSPVPPGSAAAEMLARPVVAGPEREQMPHIDERIEKAQQALAARSAELDKKAEGLGPAAERLVRSIGERYNRLSMKQKLLVGGVLAAGAVGASVATGGASIWWTFGILSGYRAVAGAGAFVALEGALQHAKEKNDKLWNRHPKVYAATAAALIASGLVGKGIGLVADSSGVSGWLKAHWPFGGTPNHPAPGVKAPGVTAAGPSVEVRPGYGYESMIRQLAGQLKGQNPNLYPADSDAYRLLNAKPERLNSVILQIEKEHGFVKPDGSSAVVGQGSRMSFDAQGRLTPENTLAPRGAVAAPEVSPRAGATVAPSVERGPTATDLNKQELSRIKAGPPPAMPGENAIAPNAPVVPGPENLIPPSVMAPYPTAPFVNHFNVPVDPTQGGIYQGTNNAPIAFANDPARAMAAAEAYARAHHRVPIWVQAPEPYMNHGVPQPYAIPVEHRGFLRGGLHHGILPPGGPPPRDWMGAVDPRTFTKRLN
ncbi:MAG: hypothetical protein Q7S95_01970 [bacterium]|nr:hypothetical protein [bacterium]